jgi:putative ABC transport system permease protein
MLQDYFKLAWTSLTHKKLRSWLTLLGIFIGITAVVSLISLGDGLRNAVTSQFGISSTEVITVQAGGLNGQGPPGTGVVNPLTTDDVDAIADINSVEKAFSRVIETGPTEFNDILSFEFATNIPDGEDRDFVYDLLEVEPEFGRLLRDGDIKKVVVGYNQGANAAGFEKAMKVGDTINFKGQDFEIVGVLERKGSFIFDNIMLMNQDDLQELLEDPDRVDIIAIQVKDKDLIGEAKLDIEKVMRKQRDVKVGEEDFEVQTPEAALSTVNGILVGIQIFIVMIASISILIGALGIVNTMTTSVLERKPQIGIMKAIGAKNSDIFMLFFIESGFMGLAGGVAGTFFGVIIGYAGTIALNSWVSSAAAPEINWILVISALVGSFVIGSISGIIPALNAANEKPVDALRG